MAEPMVLRFPRGGMGKLTIQSDPGLADVCRTEFVGQEPDFSVEGRTIDITYEKMWLFNNAKREATVTLNETVPWQVELRGGVGKAEFDLERLNVDGITLEGGVAKLEVRLGQPQGAVPLAIRGGLAKAEIRRPVGVPVRVHVSGGAAKIEVDGQMFAGVGSGFRWETPGFAAATGGYEITITGGCAKLEVTED